MTAPPPEELELAEEEGEPELGSTPAGLAANRALRATARAARSFLLYDPKNEAIRHFLEEYRATMKEALGHGPLELDVRPFEFVYHGEVVYLERDWERSLAFRCYRDGVRRIVIHPDVTWDELLRLLGILSIRYTGVRQQEDDIVTLLWKAGFRHVETIAVEGFVPEEEDDDEYGEADENRETAALRRSASRIDVPPDWDLPIEPHEEFAVVRYRALSDAELEPLRSEVSSTALPRLTLRLVREMLLLASDAADPTEVSDIVHTIGEIRGFLMSEGQVGVLLELVRLLRDHRELAPDAIDDVLRQFTDESAVRRVLHSVSSAAETVPEELVELLELVPGDHLAILVRVLGVERSQASRRIARQLIERYVQTRIEYIEEQLTTAAPEVAADLLRAVASASIEHGVRLAHRLANTDAPEIQLQVRHVLEEARPEDVGIERLLDMLRSPMKEVRLRVIDMLVELGDRAAFDALHHHLEHPPRGGLGRDEMIAVGQALARLDPDRAWETFIDVVRPRRVIERFFAGGATQRPARVWAGVAALGLVPRREAEDAIRWLDRRAGEDLHQHCMRTLAHRRREGIGDDG